MFRLELAIIRWNKLLQETAAFFILISLCDVLCMGWPLHSSVLCYGCCNTTVTQQGWVKCLLPSACTSMSVELHNALLGNSHTAAPQGAMPPLNLLSAVAAVPVCVVSIFPTWQDAVRRLPARVYRRMLCYIVDDVLVGIWRPGAIDCLDYV
jgi:hypothetical protein